MMLLLFHYFLTTYLLFQDLTKGKGIELGYYIQIVNKDVVILDYLLNMFYFLGRQHYGMATIVLVYV